LPNFVALLCLWMAAGLTLTGLVTHLTIALLTAAPSVVRMIHNLPILFVLVLAVQFGVVFAVSALLLRLPTPVAVLLFLLYAAGNGLWMAGIVLLYAAIPLDTGLYVTAGMFALLAVLVVLTKADLLHPGALVVMVFDGGLVATVTNFLLHGSIMGLLVNAVCIGVFVLLFAFDRERLR
jgi:hypothetical protein